MPQKSTGDKYVNQAVIEATESAANTLTFKKLETGISLFEKVAWLIERVEYFFSDYGLLGTTDSVTFALTTTDQMASLSLKNAAVIDYMNILDLNDGAPATSFRIIQPTTKDFSQMSGGGLLVPPNPFYLGIVGVGLASPATVTAKIFYTTVQLTPDEYWELVESRRIISS